ncbi:MAG: hypothetical protein WBW73_10315 [Rhodoplanes sp.]
MLFTLVGIAGEDDMDAPNLAAAKPSPGDGRTATVKRCGQRKCPRGARSLLLPV